MLVRRLVGGGIHDGDEIVALPEDALDGVATTVADENAYDGDAWGLDRELAAHDGVITQSVTLASEAALLGTPVLLISAAERGFLDRLEQEGAPLFRWRGPKTRPSGERSMPNSWQVCTSRMRWSLRRGPMQKANLRTI